MLTTNCSNNYGPYHFPEKLIPLCILKALQGQDLPIYGDGQQVRDWLYVVDHCKGIATVLEKGVIGETYNIGGWNEKANLEVVHTLCDLLDELKPREDGKSYREQITFVKDRPGMIVAMRLMPLKFPMNSAGNPKKPLRRVSVKPSSGTSTTRTGSLTCSRASTNTGSIKTIHEDLNYGH